MQIAHPFFYYAQKTPSHLALHIDQKNYSYQELAKRASQLAQWFKGNNIKQIGVTTSRTLSAYLAILAASWANIAYVPLNLKLPPERLANIIKNSEIDAILLDENSILNISNALLLINHFFPWIINPEQSVSIQLPMGLVVLGEEDLGHKKLVKPIVGEAQDLVYLMFTSGSTGEPKGVPIHLGNLNHYFNAMNLRYAFNADDRFAQCTQLSFDPSVQDMMMAWSHGASLWVVPESQLMAPAKFIRDYHLTVWSSVPSIIGFMSQFKMLQPGVFPHLRYSLFGGEMLTLNYAEYWQVAAPNSIIDNVYGPTECTICCTAYRYCPLDQTTHSRKTLPIGQPNFGLKAAILDEDHHFLPNGQAGELIISGPQVFTGYWKDADKTAERLVLLNSMDSDDTHSVPTIWYKTGDYCIQDAEGCLSYLGRLDNQCKINGYRIELEEVENFLRTAAGCEDVAAILLPARSGVGHSLIGIVQAEENKINKLAIKDYLKTVLPAYMVPEEIGCLSEFPRNINGKLDRKLLAERIKCALYETKTNAFEWTESFKQPDFDKFTN